MATIETKEKILNTALTLFNSEGLVNVRLQHISDKAVISLGNISYHFRNKEAIVIAIWEKIRMEQEIILTEFKTVPLFEDIERYILAQFLLQSKNEFFYKDTLEIIRTYPEIAQSYGRHQTWQINQFSLMLHFNEARGALKKTKKNDFNSYDLVASVWMWMSDNWYQRQSILNFDPRDYKNYNFTLWSLLWPRMTKKGKLEFSNLQNNTVYGKEFFY